MRFLLAAALTIVTAFAQDTTSAVFDGSTHARANIPNNSTFNAVTNMVVEFRLTNYTLGAAGNKGVFFLGGIYGYLTSSANSISISDASAGYTIVMDLAGKTDVVIRLVRSAGYEWAETWTVSGGRLACTNSTINTAPASENFSGSPAIGVADGQAADMTGRLAYFRWGTSGVPAVANRCRVAPSNIDSGNLAQYKFANNLLDSSGNSLDLTQTGTTTYASTTFQAYSQLTDINGLPAQISATETARRSGVAFTLDGSASSAASYAWTQTSGTSCSGNTGSSATMTPTCSGFGQRTFQLIADGSTITMDVGIVAADANGVVDVATESSSIIAFLAGDQLMSGMSTWTDYDRALADRSDYWYGEPGSSRGDTRCQAAQTCTWAYLVVQGDFDLVYYDSALVNYAEYFRTGLTKFLTRADAVALYWWNSSAWWNGGSPMGGCAANEPPRVVSIAGLMLYERLNSDTSMWSCLQDWLDAEFTLYIENHGTDNGNTSPYFGIRESGYAYYYATLMSQAHPTSGTRSTWLSRITTEYTNYVAPYACPSTSTTMACTTRGATSTGTVSATNGATSVSGSGTAFTTDYSNGSAIWIASATGIYNLYEVATVTNDTALVLSTNYAETTGSGRAHAHNIAQSRFGGYSWQENTTAGYAGFIEQAWHSGIMLEGVINYYELTGDSTALTLLANWAANQWTNEVNTDACSGLSGIYANATHYADFAAGQTPPSSLDPCTNAASVEGQRAANNTVAHVYGYLYQQTGTTLYKTRGDILFGATFGLYSGTNSDGYAGLMFTAGNDGKQFGQSFRSSSRYLSYIASPATTTTPRFGSTARVSSAVR